MKGKFNLKEVTVILLMIILIVISFLPYNYLLNMITIILGGVSVLVFKVILPLLRNFKARSKGFFAFLSPALSALMLIFIAAYFLSKNSIYTLLTVGCAAADIFVDFYVDSKDK